MTVAGTESRSASATGHRARLDFWVAILTALTTAISFLAAILTLPKSGPFCTGNCVGYPYTDITAYIPRDFLWMYPALLPAPLFMMLACALHERASIDRKRFSRLAVSFSVIAATLLGADYFIQLRVIQPAILKAELEGLAALSQYNPHGIFIALEEAGYLFMGIAFLFAGLAISARDRLHRVVRWVFGAGFATIVLLFVGMSIAYGFEVEYRFEVAAITVDWTVLIIAGALLGIAYRQEADGLHR
jgi:uncharacterized membrane protein YhaH (DUF805 family)